MESSIYPLHEVIERIVREIEVEGLHFIKKPLRVQIAPPGT